jgi:DNA polymerase-1
VLEELAETYDLPRLLILEYRGLAKLKSTYTDKLPEMIKPTTGRVHTSYHQAVAPPAGCRRPIPTCRTSRSARRRAAASARPSSRAPGYKLVAADYSQIELRIMAHLSGDQGLLTRLRRGQGRPQGHRRRSVGVALDA